MQKIDALHEKTTQAVAELGDDVEENGDDGEIDENGQRTKRAKAKRKGYFLFFLLVNLKNV